MGDPQLVTADPVWVVSMPGAGGTGPVSPQRAALQPNGWHGRGAASDELLNL